MRIHHDPEAGCGKCPMRRSVADEEGDRDDECAAAPALSLPFLVWYGAAPNWCPLRAGDVVVTAQENDDE